MSDFATRVYLTLSVYGVILGISALITFAFLENNLAALWAFISATYALMNVILHFLQIIDKLGEYYSIKTLSTINYFAFISAAIFTALLVWYIFDIFYFKLTTLPVKDSYAIIAVWTFMSTKWASLLVVATNRYIKILTNSGRPLLQN